MLRTTDSTNKCLFCSFTEGSSVFDDEWNEVAVSSVLAEMHNQRA
jgi:hypothetical protein